MKNSEIKIYKTPDGKTSVEVKLEKETVWLTQKQMAELFDRDSDTIGLHLKNIYQSGELEEVSTAEKYSVVRQEGNRKVKRTIKHYNLDTVISVGYRVSSYKATKFRQWATSILKEYILTATTNIDAEAILKISNHIEAFVVPGSGLVKEQAEQEGLDKIFKNSIVHFSRLALYQKNNGMFLTFLT